MQTRSQWALSWHSLQDKNPLMQPAIRWRSRPKPDIEFRVEMLLSRPAKRTLVDTAAIKVSE